MAQKQFFAIGKGKSGATVMQIAPNNVQRSDASIDIICITGRVKNYSKKNKNKKKMWFGPSRAVSTIEKIKANFGARFKTGFY